LRLFEEGQTKERIDFVENFTFNNTTAPAHRYMGRLLVKQPCLRCHEKYGYKLGDVRGGVSVSMPAGDLLAVRDQRLQSSLWIILTSFLLTAGLMHLLVARARRHYLQLRGLVQAQEGIIEERTRELEERNHELHREVDERRRREHELRLAGAVFESAAEAIMVTDAGNRIIRVNPAFTAITGYTAAEVLGQDPLMLSSGRHAEAFFAALRTALETTGQWAGEIWNRRKNGDVYVAWLSIARIEGDASGQGHSLAIFQDITLRKEAEEKLRHRAYHDVLTDLPNRTLFFDRLEAAFNQAKRYQRSFALLMVDLDRFKDVNDSLGHPAGDELLVEAAHRLMSCVRESDTVARLGGDEFALIITDMVDSGEAERVARRAVELLAEPYHLDAGTVRISGCVGIAQYPQHGQDSEELQRNADIALYDAKAGGRNGFRTYRPAARGARAQGDLL
jgi:diguanylate cyclase (GGDEF)-like protein/PAS domain S-box-containing protein